MSCRVFVQVWCEIDPTLNVRIDRQTAAPLVDEGDRLTRVSPLGRRGVEEALRLPGAEVTAFSLAVGEDQAQEPALRHALAAGAIRAVQLQFSGPPAGDALISGLAGWLGSQAPDLVIADRLAGSVAARLGWAHLAGLEQLCLGPGALAALRPLGRSGHEEVTAQLPAIVRLNPESPRPRYIALARLAQAYLHPLETVVLSAAGSESTVDIGPLQIMRPRTRLGAAPAAATPAKATDRLNALMGIGARAQAKPASKPTAPVAKTEEQMAEEFVRYLAHQGLLDDR